MNNETNIQQNVDGEVVLKETMQAFIASAFIVSLLANLTVLVTWLAVTLA
jgi:hypothetical protein